MSPGKANSWHYAKRDFLPSILVGPVSLMFAIGLSFVAHTPVESGIIAVLVGGFVVSGFGGGFVNISGPGVHSAAVWMLGCLILGGGEFHHGFRWMLAAGVVTGVMQITVGLTRQAHRLDMIPLSVRRGIVSMLGVWIVISQLTLLLGADADRSYGSVGEILTSYPDLIERAVNGTTEYLISGFGLLALVFMIIYSSYQNRLIRMLPAPIWLFAGGIAASLYLSINYGTGYPESLGVQVKLASGLDEWIRTPQWSAVHLLKFWTVTLGLFLVTWNESVRNLRATDRLDLQHRRTDINNEMAALGAATVLSCFIGGMNVTATIAQSSTNTQLRAQTRWSNLNNAVVVLLLVTFGAPFIEQLLIPAVAAMMIYIGYRMAAPSHLRAVAEIGWEDFIGLVVTFVIAWIFGIFYGILSGVLVLFLLQLITSGKAGYILRFALRPSTLLYQEDNNAYLLSIKYYGNFLNLSRIREKIDSVPSSSEMIVDFSLSKFVDQNVLIQLEYYEEIFMRRGGRFEVVGVDDLPTTVHHPFASWMPFGEAPSETGPLSNRQEALSAWAEDRGYTYHPSLLFTGQPFYAFHYFRSLQIEGQRNRIVGKIRDLGFVLADVDYHQGEFIARGSTHCTMMMLATEGSVPQFVLDRERLLDRVATLAGFSDINFDGHPEFSSKFRLRGANERAIRDFFSDDLIELLHNYPEYHIEARGKQILIFEKERLAGANEMKGMVSFAEKLTPFLKNGEE